MLTVKATMKSEALYSDNQEHRFLIKRTWNASQPSAAILMLAPSDTANEIAMDTTAILNLYSGLQLQRPFSPKACRYAGSLDCYGSGAGGVCNENSRK